MLLVIGCGAWLIYTGLKARTELEAVRAGVHNLRADVAAGNLSAARADADAVRAHSDRAYDLTTGPVWAVAAAIPYLGDPLDTAGQSRRVCIRSPTEHSRPSSTPRTA